MFLLFRHIVMLALCLVTRAIGVATAGSILRRSSTICARRTRRRASARLAPGQLSAFSTVCMWVCGLLACVYVCACVRAHGRRHWALRWSQQVSRSRTGRANSQCMLGVDSFNCCLGSSCHSARSAVGFTGTPEHGFQCVLCH